MKRFRGGLVFKAPGLFYRSTLGLRVIKEEEVEAPVARRRSSVPLGGKELRVIFLAGSLGDYFKLTRWVAGTGVPRL